MVCIFGIDVFKTRTDITVNNVSTSEKQDFEAVSQTLKAGYYLGRNSRVNAFYQHQNTTLANGNGSLYGIGFNYLIGGLAGYSHYSQPDLDLDSGFIGVNLGLNYAFGENFSIEGGYRYMLSNANATFTTSRSEAQVDTLKNWYVGGNYKF